MEIKSTHRRKLRTLRVAATLCCALSPTLGCVTSTHAESVTVGWVDRAPMDRPRIFHIAGVGGDGRIYAYAGRVEKEMKVGTVLANGDNDLAIDAYDPDSDGWSQGPPVTAYFLVSLKRVILKNPAPPYEILLDHVQESRVESRLNPEYPSGGAGSDGRLYWFAGAGPVFFDPNSSSWGQGEPVLMEPEHERYVPPISKWFRHMATTGVGPDGRFYLAGGTGYPIAYGIVKLGPHRILDSLEIYDPRTREWKEGAPLRLARQMAAATFAPDGKLYVFGGYGALGTSVKLPEETDAEFAARDRLDRRLSRAALRSVEAYDPATDSWEDRAPMPAGRQSMGAALGADGRIYVVGGADQYSNPAPKAEVFIYDPKTDSWSEGPPLNHPRYHHAVVATPDGRIWAIGGTNGTNRWGALPRGEPEGLVRPIEMLDTRPVRARPLSEPDAAPN